MSMKSAQASSFADMYSTLRDAVDELYYAAAWHADRPVDEQRLWTAVRDAAGFKSGDSPKEIPFDGVQASYGIDRLRQIAGHVRAGKHSATDFTTEKTRAFLLLHGEELQDRIDDAVRKFLEEKLS